MIDDIEVVRRVKRRIIELKDMTPTQARRILEILNEPKEENKRK